MAGNLPAWSVEAPPGVPPTVTVNGEPVPGIVAATVLAAGGEVPRLILEAHGDIVVEGVGVAEVTAPEGDELAGWLERIDPDELSRAALANTSMGVSPGLPTGDG